MKTLHLHTKYSKHTLCGIKRKGELSARFWDYPAVWNKGGCTLCPGCLAAFVSG